MNQMAALRRKQKSTRQIQEKFAEVQKFVNMPSQFVCIQWYQYTVLNTLHYKATQATAQRNSPIAQHHLVIGDTQRPLETSLILLLMK